MIELIIIGLLSAAEVKVLPPQPPAEKVVIYTYRCINDPPAMVRQKQAVLSDGAVEAVVMMHLRAAAQFECMHGSGK